MHITTLGIRFGEECVPVARGGCARASGAQPTGEASAVIRYGGESAALCDRDGGGREVRITGGGRLNRSGIPSS